MHARVIMHLLILGGGHVPPQAPPYLRPCTPMHTDVHIFHDDLRNDHDDPSPHHQTRLTQFYDKGTNYPFTFLEVNGPNGWGSLCYNDIFNSVKFSDVVCREASSMFSYSVMRGVVTPPYKGPLYSGSGACNGTEWSLSECMTQQLSVMSDASCPNGQTVVQCTPGECV